MSKAVVGWMPSRNVQSFARAAHISTNYATRNSLFRHPAIVCEIERFLSFQLVSLYDRDPADFFYSNILHLLYLLLNLFLLLLLIYLLGMSLLNYLLGIYRFRHHRNNQYSLLYLFLLLHVLFICT